MIMSYRHSIGSELRAFVNGHLMIENVATFIAGCYQGIHAAMNAQSQDEKQSMRSVKAGLALLISFKIDEERIVHRSSAKYYNIATEGIPKPIKQRVQKLLNDELKSNELLRQAIFPNY
jgi:hypothetical protein